MSYRNDDKNELLFVSGIYLLAAIVGAFLLNALNAQYCRSYARMVGMETRYELGTCYVKQGDQFYPRDELLLRNSAKGARQ